MRVLRGGPHASLSSPTPGSQASAADGRASTADPAIGAAYHAAIAALTDRGRYGMRLGLGRTRALLRGLGDPQLELRGALIAGTNGKGSVLALASAALRAAGIRTGETPKPHLVTYRERLQIGGHPISPGAFADLVAEIEPIAERVARRLGPPTEFELLTAMLFRWFARERVEVAVVEVGLGGRLDATHAWNGGVAAVTNVDLDHMAQLGPTIPAIAREKAAIIERGDVAVTGATGEGLQVIRRRARRLGVPLTEVASPPVIELDLEGLVVELPGLGQTRIGLLGRHQAANAGVANAVLDALEVAGIARVPPAARREGFAAARWPGRLERITWRGRQILLDGAHNPAGARALGAALDELRPLLVGGAATPPAPVTLVTGVMADKDVEGLVAALAGAGALAGARIIATRVDLPRALAAEDLATRWRAAGIGATVLAIDDLDIALETALGTGDGPIVVAGSLYLVGEARRRWHPDPTLDDPPREDR